MGLIKCGTDREERIALTSWPTKPVDRKFVARGDDSGGIMIDGARSGFGIGFGILLGMFAGGTVIKKLKGG
jgi:hypothetical protein